MMISSLLVCEGRQDISVSCEAYPETFGRKLHDSRRRFSLNVPEAHHALGVFGGEGLSSRVDVSSDVLPIVASEDPRRRQAFVEDLMHHYGAVVDDSEPLAVVEVDLRLPGPLLHVEVEIGQGKALDRAVKRHGVEVHLAAFGNQ